MYSNKKLSPQLLQPLLSAYHNIINTLIGNLDSPDWYEHLCSEYGGVKIEKPLELKLRETNKNEWLNIKSSDKDNIIASIQYKIAECRQKAHMLFSYLTVDKNVRDIYCFAIVGNPQHNVVLARTEDIQQNQQVGKPPCIVLMNNDVLLDPWVESVYLYNGKTYSIDSLESKEFGFKITPATQKGLKVLNSDVIEHSTNINMVPGILKWNKSFGFTTLGGGSVKDGDANTTQTQLFDVLKEEVKKHIFYAQNSNVTKLKILEEKFAEKQKLCQQQLLQNIKPPDILSQCEIFHQQAQRPGNQEEEKKKSGDLITFEENVKITQTNPQQQQIPSNQPQPQYPEQEEKKEKSESSNPPDFFSNLKRTEKNNLKLRNITASIVSKHGYNFRKELSIINPDKQEGVKKLIEAGDKSKLWPPFIGIRIVGKVGKVTFMLEKNHLTDHKKHILQLIEKINNNEIRYDSVIALERKEAGENLGMNDVKTLAAVLEYNSDNKNSDKIILPNGTENSPIYWDAMLYNSAKKRGIKVLGVEGKDLEHDKNSSEYNKDREEYMAKQIAEIVEHGHDVIMPIGSAHIHSMENRLKPYLETKTSFKQQEEKETVLPNPPCP